MRNRIKRILKQERGMALLFVLCLFAILIGLGASIFFASVTSVRTAAEEGASHQAYLSAYSACEAIKSQIDAKTITSETELSKLVSGLSINESLPISGNLPGKMGLVEGSFERKTKQMGVLKITAYLETPDHSGRLTDQVSYTLCLVFSRKEASLGNAAGWEFQQYVPAADVD